MTSPTHAFDAHLPTRIDRAEFNDPNLLVGGVGWSLSAICCWRWITADRAVVSGDAAGAEDRIWDLVGETIVRVTWRGPLALGVDPCFELSSGGQLELFSDATFDTWVLDTGGLVLVGPLLIGEVE
ncbi:MAG: hypothetical protein K8R99_02625 [Actinomycetia bacterium]|nr:hypothetical protein [Actinomycetes bacterium]